MKPIRMMSMFVSRLFLSLVFLISGVAKLCNWHEAEQSLMNALCDWQSLFGFSQGFQHFLTLAIPWTPVLLLLGSLVEIVGALMILLGFRERLAAGLLILVVLPTIFLFHPFWSLEGAARILQTELFFQNLAICGGLILVSMHGVQVRSSEEASFAHMGMS